LTDNPSYIQKIRQPNRIYQTISWKGKAWEREDECWIHEYDGDAHGAPRNRTQTNEAIGVAEETYQKDGTKDQRTKLTVMGSRGTSGSQSMRTWSSQWWKNPPERCRRKHRWIRDLKPLFSLGRLHYTYILPISTRNSVPPLNDPTPPFRQMNDVIVHIHMELHLNRLHLLL
jgi:hypothetical protein